MKKMLMLVVGIVLLSTTGTALATIDWAGGVWPNSGADIVPTEPLNVYAQVYKGGVTDAEGQGADITAVLQYTTDIAPMVEVSMTYNSDVGSNDEYTAQVPQAALAGATQVSATVRFADLTDGSVFEVTGDQAQNPPPFIYNVVNVLPNDILVNFSLCMSGEEFMGVPCVIGSAPEIGSWGTGVNMTQVDGDLFEVSILFAAGGNPSFEYKFKKNDCVDWESVDNRLVSLPTDGTTEVTLELQSWNNLPLGCDQGEVLAEDKEVCFQVCMMDVEYTGNVCVIGSGEQLSDWTTGVVMTPLGGDLFQVCVVYPAGIAIPLNVEYKFKKDECETWESVDNRALTVDNNLEAITTLVNTWDDGPGGCEPVATENSTWGGLKSLYR